VISPSISLARKIRFGGFGAASTALQTVAKVLLRRPNLWHGWLSYQLPRTSGIKRSSKPTIGTHFLNVPIETHNVVSLINAGNVPQVYIDELNIFWEDIV
jgi:hypothetical protein